MGKLDASDLAERAVAAIADDDIRIVTSAIVVFEYLDEDGDVGTGLVTSNGLSDATGLGLARLAEARFAQCALERFRPAEDD